MILRRITEHVKAQNWFAVAIDFVIVGPEAPLAAGVVEKAADVGAGEGRPGQAHVEQLGDRHLQVVPAGGVVGRVRQRADVRGGECRVVTVEAECPQEARRGRRRRRAGTPRTGRGPGSCRRS